MATVYSAQKTKWDQTTPAVKIIPSEHAGRVRISYALYEASSLSAGDVIEMFNLPNDARVLSGQLVHDALGSSTTLSVGHAAYKNSSSTVVALDVDEWKAAAASTSITSVDIVATSALGKNTIVDADGDGIPITVVLAGATGSGTIELTMYWVLD
jgi:hypothetical protein